MTSRATWIAALGDDSNIPVAQAIPIDDDWEEEVMVEANTVQGRRMVERTSYREERVMIPRGSRAIVQEHCIVERRRNCAAEVVVPREVRSRPGCGGMQCGNQPPKSLREKLWTAKQLRKEAKRKWKEKASASLREGGGGRIESTCE